MLEAILAALLADEESRTEPASIQYRPLVSYGGSSVIVPEPEPPSFELPQVASATLELDLHTIDSGFVDGNPASPWLETSGNNRTFTGNRVFHDDASGGYVDGNGEDQYLQGSDFADNLENIAIFVVLKDAGWGGQVLSKVNYSNDGDDADGIQTVLQGSNGLNPYFAIRQGSNGYAVLAQDEITTPCVLVFQKLGNGLPGQLSIYSNDSLLSVDESSTGTVSTFATSEPWRIGVAGGVDGPSANGYSPHAGRDYKIYRITDLDNWATDRDALVIWLASQYELTL